MHPRPRVLAALPNALAGLLLAGCGGDQVTDLNVGTRVAVQVDSPAFEAGAAVPVRFTCDGDGTSPPLAWSDAEEGTAAWAIVVDDPDAPGGTFVHWVVLDIPVDVRSVEEGRTPPGAVQARNSTGEADYFGPCPPEGLHRYRFSVYALQQPTGLPDGVDLSEALSAVGDAAVGRGTLLGTYQRR